MFKCFWIAPFVTDAAAVNLNGTKTLLAYSLSTFPINGKLIFSDGPKSLLRNPPNCTIVDNRVFENLY